MTEPLLWTSSPFYTCVHNEHYFSFLTLYTLLPTTYQAKIKIAPIQQITLLCLSLLIRRTPLSADRYSEFRISKIDIIASHPSRLIRVTSLTAPQEAGLLWPMNPYSSARATVEA